MTWVEAHEENCRRDRWHATRDAFVAGMAAAGEISGEFILSRATKCADLAHGPLEKKP
jgi:cysteine synthase